MRLAAHQPQYLPWLGYFHKMDCADVFVLLDTVQYKKNEWQNRNRIRTASGWQWMTVPVHYRYPMSIREVLVDDTSGWRRKHVEALRQSYGRASHKDAILPRLVALLDRPLQSLSAINIESIRLLAGLLGVETRVAVASTLEGVAEGADERLIDLCRRFGCTTYLAGQGGHDYMNLDLWRSSGIEVEFQEFRHPVYSQGRGGFEPNLSAVDFLMHQGPGSAERLEARHTRAA